MHILKIFVKRKILKFQKYKDFCIADFTGCVCNLLPLRRRHRVNRPKGLGYKWSVNKSENIVWPTKDRLEQGWHAKMCTIIYYIIGKNINVPK